MQIEPQIRDIPLNSIDEIEWLKIREPEGDNLTYLGLSLTTKSATPADPNNADDPTSWEDFLLQMPVGQLAPVRVIRYPPELQLSLPKDYGLIFGYRRWRAAKQSGLTTIKAQIIHLSIEEYRDNKTKFFLLLMGFTENVERENLTGQDHFKAVKQLKDKYEAIYPKSSRRFKHLTQGRNAKGHFTHTTGQRPPTFNKALQKITKKSQQRIDEEFQVGSLLTSTLINDRYKGLINKSAALLLAKISNDQQIAVLNQLATQHLPFTVTNIENAIHQRQRHPIGASSANTHKHTVTPDSGITASPHDSKHLAPAAVLPSTDGTSLPDLAIVTAVITLCLDLRHHFTWTPAAIRETLPLFDDLLSASQTLADYLRHEKAILDGHLSRTSTSTTAHGSNGTSKHVLQHVER